MGSELTRSQSGYLARSGEGSKAPPSASPPQTTVPQAWGQAGAASPAQPGRPGAHRADGEAAGWVGRALPGEQSPRHALLTPRADKRSLRGCRKPRAPCPHSVGKVRPPAPSGPSAPAPSGTSPTLVADPRARSAARLPTTLAHRCPAAPSGCPSLRRRPTMGSPRRRCRCGAETRAPGAQGGATPAPTCLPPPAARPHSREAYFSRACPSEGTAEPLPLANMACREEGAEPAAAAAATVRSPELPCSRPPPGARPLARTPLAALPPSQALAPRSFQLSKRQPRPRPHRPGTPPAPARPELRRRPPDACSSLARGPARSPPRLRLRRPLRLQHRCRCRRRRRWSTWSSTERGCPGRSAAGVHAPRRTAAAANRRAGAGPEAERDACQRGRASPAAPPPRAAARSCPGQGSGGRALALGWGGDSRGSGVDWSTRPARRGLGAATAGEDPGWPGAPLFASA